MQALTKVAQRLDDVNRAIGMSVAWFALFMVLVQFLVVVLRYVFGYGSIFLQESTIYLHGLLFMLGAGYTLLRGGHVRVDVLYSAAAPKTKAAIDLFGVCCFLIPVCLTIGWFAFPYTLNSWKILESSNESSGIPAIFILKSSILVFCILMIMQGVSLAIHSLAILTDTAVDEPDREDADG
ncbi:MAG: TRAP transporter small permease subunit [Alphaproteobacteria bacterium]